MKKEYILNSIPASFCTAPNTYERHLEVLEKFSYILDCQKKHWKEAVKSAFKFHVMSTLSDNTSLKNSHLERLGWYFHREIFYAMCDAWKYEE